MTRLAAGARSKDLARYLPNELRWIYETVILRRNARPRAIQTPKFLAHLKHHRGSDKSATRPSLVQPHEINQKKPSPLNEVCAFSKRNILRALRIWSVARDEVSLLTTGVLQQLEEPSHAIRVGVSNRAIYLAYNSLPFHSAGYATRTHGLVAGMRALGLDSVIVTRLGYPQLFEKFQSTRPETREVIDDIPYVRLIAEAPELTALSNKRYIGLNTKALIRASDEIRPSLIHAASNFVTGLTAVAAARALGVPSVYEVRGLWEVTALSRDPSYANTLHYAHAVHLETEACLEADRVITITEALKSELIRRGVPEGKIDVVPNGVDTNRFQPRLRDADLGLRLGLSPDHVVVGYVGSILDYEGLDDLLHAFRLCVDQGATDLRLLIVGDGAAYEDCIALSDKLELGDYVIFTGRVPHEKVEAYYSLIDITPFPRKPLPVCEMVSPLKPFEAMAMGKCIIVSSVAALSEIIGDRPVGFVHEKGNIEALAQTLSYVAADRSLRAEVGENARRFVVAERDWRILAQQITKIYENLPNGQQ